MIYSTILLSDFLQRPEFVAGLKADIIRHARTGKIFTVTFEKKNGEIRKMNCRTGVTRYLKGGNSTVADKLHLLPVYDLKAGGYRNINLRTVRRVAFGGKVVLFK